MRNWLVGEAADEDCREVARRVVIALPRLAALALKNAPHLLRGILTVFDDDLRFLLLLLLLHCFSLREP